MKLWLMGAVFVALLMGATWAMVGGDIGNNDYMGKLAVVGALAIAVIAIFVSIKYVRQIQEETATGELADENWDGIGEYKNELPMGWAILFLLTTIWGIWYFLAGYPVNAYSQIGEYNEEVATYNAEFAAKHANMDADTLVKMGESVFIVNCSQCHGLDADGIDGKAADLNSRISKENVIYTVKNGANNLKSTFPGGMPPMMLQDDAQIAAVADYIVAGFPAGHEGEQYFAMGGCTGCHGEKGEGMPGVGPKLNGFDEATVAAVLKDGKKGAIGRMPAFDILNEQQIKAVGAYISSLSAN